LNKFISLQKSYFIQQNKKNIFFGIFFQKE